MNLQAQFHTVAVVDAGVSGRRMRASLQAQPRFQSLASVRGFDAVLDH